MSSGGGGFAKTHNCVKTLLEMHSFLHHEWKLIMLSKDSWAVTAGALPRSRAPYLCCSLLQMYGSAVAWEHIAAQEQLDSTVSIHFC